MSARVLNEAVDRLLDAVNGLIIEAGLDKMNVSDLEHDWEIGWNFVRVSGTISCRGGWLRKLSSLRRTGDVILATHDDCFTLKAKLGFGELAFGYKTCKASAK